VAAKKEGLSVDELKGDRRVDNVVTQRGEKLNVRRGKCRILENAGNVLGHLPFYMLMIPLARWILKKMQDTKKETYRALRP
jgi:hypothetical protein